MGISFTGGIKLKDGSLKQDFNNPPIWVTSAGNLGTLTSGATLTSLNLALSATDSDGGPDNITYTIVRGALPTGGTLDTNTGAITGPIVLDGTNSAVTFTVRASDGRDFADREFNIFVEEFVGDNSTPIPGYEFLAWWPHDDTGTNLTNHISGVVDTPSGLVRSTQNGYPAVKYGGAIQNSTPAQFGSSKTNYTNVAWFSNNGYGNSGSSNFISFIEGAGSTNWNINNDGITGGGFVLRDNGSPKTYDVSGISGLHMFAWTHDGNTVRFYVNGVFATQFITSFNSVSELSLGGNSQGQDNTYRHAAAVFDGTMSDANIATLYSMGPEGLNDSTAYTLADEHFSNVVILTPFDTNFNDISNNNLIPTTLGAPILDGSGKFNSCVDLTNGMSILTYNSPTDFKFGLDDFTIEYWVRPDLNSQTNYRCHTSSSPSAPAQGGWFIGTDPNGDLYYALGGNGSWNFDTIVTNQNIPQEQWSHIAFSRNNNIIKVYINGQEVSSENATGITIGNNHEVCQIGGRNYSTQYSGARIDDFRITKGVGRYPTNFTPPTTPF